MIGDNIILKLVISYHLMRYSDQKFIQTLEVIQTAPLEQVALNGYNSHWLRN